MARKYNWNAEKYRAALVGNKSAGVEGLRSLAKGFDSSDGYNLNRIDKWTPAQRRRVRDYFARVEQLEAQSKLIVRPQSTKALKKLQDAFHGDVPSKDFKVAFVPYHRPKVTLPGSKRAKVRIRVLTEGISIKNGRYERVFIPFNQKALARDPKREIKRAAEKIPGASLFFVQVGDNQTLNGKSLGLITSEILKWMEQYDGVTPLPKSSGNRGDNPKDHHYKRWLNGLVGYVLPKSADVRTMGRIIREGRELNEDRKRKMRNYMKRTGRKRK